MSELADFWRITKEFDYFIGAIALGLLIGFWLGRRSTGWRDLTANRVVEGAVHGVQMYVRVIYAVAAIAGGFIIVKDVFFPDPVPAEHTGPAASAVSERIAPN